LTPVVDTLSEEPPANRAVVLNALAVALLLENVLDPRVVTNSSAVSIVPAPHPFEALDRRGSDEPFRLIH
jgi:hypothetical protein